MAKIIIWCLVFLYSGSFSHNTEAQNWNQTDTLKVWQKKDPLGPAVDYGGSELPQDVIPNDATISLYQSKRLIFILRRSGSGRLYTVEPGGNSSEFRFAPNLQSKAIDREMSEGFLLSYIFYDDGVIRYDGKAREGRFAQDVDNEMLFYTHSTGKSITSYIVGHAICEGYISSIDEVIDWPLMSKTLYQGQPLIDLLNMRAGDKHTIDEERSHYVMGSKEHHRNMGLDTIASLLEGTKKRGRDLFYNNFLADVLANYVAFKAGDEYDALMRKVFQEKVKIHHPIHYEKHEETLVNGEPSEFFRQPQTLASYSYFMTRLDFLRVAEAMMRDYQNETCVGNYLRQIQQKAEPWYRRGNREGPRTRLWINNYAQNYGGQFYFTFKHMEDRSIFGTEGYNGQNILIDMDNSRIVITNSAATAWDTKALMLNVIRDGKLPD